MSKAKIYIIEYYKKRGEYDASIGARKSMLMVGFSTDDVKSTFKKANPKASLVGISSDPRHVGLSADYLLNVLKTKAQGFVKAIRRQHELENVKLHQGRQYNSTIEDQDKSSLLQGL